MMQRNPARWFQRSVSDFMKTSAKRVNTESETTSWMTFSSQIEKGPPNSAEPRRLAGTWKQYSNRAMP